MPSWAGDFIWHLKAVERMKLPPLHPPDSIVSWAELSVVFHPISDQKNVHYNIHQRDKKRRKWIWHVSYHWEWAGTGFFTTTRRAIKILIYNILTLHLGSSHVVHLYIHSTNAFSRTSRCSSHSWASQRDDRDWTEKSPCGFSSTPFHLWQLFKSSSLECSRCGSDKIAGMGGSVVI